MKICLIRHGITDYNNEKRLQGWKDIALNDKGFMQARIVANQVKDYNWEVIISSDLIRARQTAEVIGNIKNIPVVFNDKLRERDFGKYSGELVENVKKLGATVEELFGETKETFEKRIMEGFTEIISTFQDKNIMIVSHGGVLRRLHKLIMAIDKKQWENTEFIIFNYLDGEWKLDA